MIKCAFKLVGSVNKIESFIVYNMELNLILHFEHSLHLKCLNISPVKIENLRNTTVCYTVPKQLNTGEFNVYALSIYFCNVSTVLSLVWMMFTISMTVFWLFYIRFVEKTVYSQFYRIQTVRCVCVYVCVYVIQCMHVCVCSVRFFFPTVVSYHAACVKMIQDLTSDTFHNAFFCSVGIHN